MNYTVIDKSRYSKKKLYKTVFLRNDCNKDSVSLLKWIYLTFFEILFGSVLLENIVNTSAGTSTREEQCQYGKEMKLNSFVPNGVTTNFFRGVLVEVLYYKFYKQYFLIRPLHQIEEHEIDRKSKTIDCSLIRFASFKEVLYQVISLRKVYELTHLATNVTIDTIVYFYTDRLDMAIFSAILIESIRRIVKI